MLSTGAVRWIRLNTSFISFDSPMMLSSPNFWSNCRRRLSISFDRQPAPPVDHADHVGIGGVVISGAIADEAIFAGDHLGERGRLFGRGGRGGADRRQPLADRGEQIAIGREIDIVMIERGEFECGGIEDDILLVDQAEMGDAGNHERDLLARFNALPARPGS